MKIILNAHLQHSLHTSPGAVSCHRQVEGLGLVIKQPVLSPF